MINDAIMAIKDRIVSTVGDSCEKVILFGSYAYGTQRQDSDYDFYVVLKDGTEKPILVLQKIYRGLAKSAMLTPVDVLANYKSYFEEMSKLPAMERKIANEGIILYERT